MNNTARAELREDCGGYKPYSVVIGREWARNAAGNIRTFATKFAAQKEANRINLVNADNKYIAPGISVQSATTELVKIGPAHPDYKG